MAGFPPLRRQELIALVGRDPQTAGCPRSRWRRVDLQARLPWLAGCSLPTVSRILRRCGVRLKRGRLRVHSPDPAYREKVRRLQRLQALARRYPDRMGLHYGDECSLYRQPTLAERWGRVGTEPTADLSHRANTRYRICGALDGTSGQVTWIGASRISVPVLCRFLRRLRAADPDRHVWLVWDNWPVHHHPAVLATAQAHDIHLVWLPTYAPWLNPIEKLWRYAKQTVLHHHRHANDWPELKTRINAVLDGYAGPSPDLLRYTGLVH